MADHVRPLAPVGPLVELVHQLLHPVFPEQVDVQPCGQGHGLGGLGLAGGAEQHLPRLAAGGVYGPLHPAAYLLQPAGDLLLRHGCPLLYSSA